MHNEKWKGAVGAGRREQLWSLTHPVLLDDLPTESHWLDILSTLWHRHQTTNPLPHQPLRLCQARNAFPTKAPIHHFFTLWLKCDVEAGNRRAKYGIKNPNCTRVVALWFPSLFNRPHNLDTHLDLPRWWWFHGARKPQHDNQALVSQFLTYFPLNVSKASLAYSCKR